MGRLTENSVISIKNKSREVNWVQIDLGLDDHSHMIPPEQCLSFAMARQ